MLCDEQIDEIILLKHVAFEGERAVVKTPPHFALLLCLETALLPAYLVVINKIFTGENLLRVDRVDNLLIFEETAYYLEFHFI